MAKKNDIIINCKKYLGTPYVWGGESEAEGGFDCSGYAYNVMRDSGMKVSRTTANGYRSIGKKIDTDSMAVSDLLFFGKNDKATHIAFYAGDNMMYESTGSSINTKLNPGKGVVLSKVSRRNDLMEVRRIADDIGSSVSTSASTIPLKINQTKKDIQIFLNTYYGEEIKRVIGANLVVDGSIGAKSKKALAIAFQVELNKLGANLVVDGSFGSKTASAFTKYVGTLKKGMKGSIFITLWQCVLVGNNIDPNGIDGSFGNGCTSATNILFGKKSISKDSSVSGADINVLL